MLAARIEQLELGGEQDLERRESGSHPTQKRPRIRGNCGSDFLLSRFPEETLKRSAGPRPGDARSGRRAQRAVGLEVVNPRLERLICLTQKLLAFAGPLQTPGADGSRSPCTRRTIWYLEEATCNGRRYRSGRKDGRTVRVGGFESKMLPARR